MTILGFDQSTQRSAYAILVDGALSDYGLIEHDRTEIPDITERIHAMFMDLAQVYFRVRPDVLVVEATQQQVSARTTIMLSQLQGMCIAAGYLGDTQVYSPLPSEWRKVLNIKQGPSVKRAELKEQSIQYVRDTYGLDLQEDIAESVCIATSQWIILRGCCCGNQKEAAGKG